MNRIYQGRVSYVEILDGKDEQGKAKWKKLDSWQSVLWQHHELFQDAVNYYTLALAALAEGVSADTAQSAAVLAWRNEVRKNWCDGRRRALRYDGPHRRLAPLLGVNASISDEQAAFDGSVRAILKPNGSSPTQRAAALIQLLEEANKNKNNLIRVCRDRIVPLCSLPGKCDATPKDTVAQQIRNMLPAVQQLHNHIGSDWNKVASKFDPGWFITRMPDKLLQGRHALKEALKRFEMVCEDEPSLKEHAQSFEEALRQQGDALSVHTPGRKVKGPYSLAVVFKLWPCAATAEALKRATLHLLNETPPELASDPIFAARVNDAPLFDYFTNWVFERTAGDENQAAWKEFDIAAFLEAIKAPHRYFQDTQKREAAADLLREQIAAMERQGSRSSEDDAEVGANFGFAEDHRIELLRELVTDPIRGLAYLADAEVGGAAEYTIQERTLRGWNAIRNRWRTLAEKNETSPEKLWAVVATEQAAHRDDFGSAMLYKKLAEPRYHPIWRDKGMQDWHADDPLRAWLQYTDLKFELEDKTRPIRFTPAHAVHSPRYFIFPKKSAAGGRWGSEHETGALAFTAGIAVRDGVKWRPQMVLVHYSAPRLNRDALRRPDEQTLDSAKWLQPMMKALDLPEPARQNFGNCRITLQPFSPDNIQLTFPVEVDPAQILSFIGKKNTWSRQFNVTPDGDNFRDSTLRWPHEKKPSKPPVPWHDATDSFHCLSIDLGQREAGAYALLDVRANHDFDKRPSRFIGETPGKKWHAALAASGLLRLSGEDRAEWRAKTSKDADDGESFDFREELHGRRGRIPREFETEECRALLDAFLGADDPKSFMIAGWEDSQSPAHLSFPEQNDKLLIAARRAQSRVARLHRWCWFLSDDKTRTVALAEIRESLNTPNDDAAHWLAPSLRDFVSTDNDPRLTTELAKLLEARLKELPDLLVRLANRVLPMRGCSWSWEPHPEATNDNRVFLLTQNGPSLDTKERPVWLRGQRGLSMERIGQIEDLRKRFQSLNQTLRRDIGGKPPIRRDESVPDPCPDLLEKLDNLKKQRVNQTAHMILAEALGVRLTKPPANKAVLKADRDQHGVYEKTLDKNGKCRGPVDFIVIEDLSRYRASQGRAPRENSRLMKWCHRAVRDKLRELCEPFGIPVLETPAAYSSRFCSRTGVAGFRAVEVTAGFENDPPWGWIKDKKSDGKLTQEAEFTLQTADKLHAAQKELEAQWQRKHPGERAHRLTLLLPQAGGPIFVPVVDSVDGLKLKPAVVQADINAAISLGLRAISDPRLWDIYPRLRTERLSGALRKRGGERKAVESTTGTDDSIRLRAREKRKFGENGPPLDIGTPPKGSALEDTGNPNYFFDIAKVAAWDKATVSDPLTNESITLSSGKAFWRAVRDIQWRRCNEINAARLRKWNVALPVSEKTRPPITGTDPTDDIPF